MKAISMVLAALMFTSVARAESKLNIETSEVLKLVIQNAKEIKLTDDLAGQSVSEVLSKFFANNLVGSEKGTVGSLTSVSSKCEYVQKTSIIECTLHLYDEDASVTEVGQYTKGDFESSTILTLRVLKAGKTLILKDNSVKGMIAG